MGIVRADSSCGFLGIGGADCKKKREAVRNVCGPLSGINLNLYDACIASCNVDNDEERPTSTDDFLCNFIGGEVLYKQYGLEGKCGYVLPPSTQNTFIKTNVQIVILLIACIILWLLID